MITPHKERFVDSCFRRACPMLDRGNDRRSRLMESPNVIPAQEWVGWVECNETHQIAVSIQMSAIGLGRNNMTALPPRLTTDS
ncbi:MAG: hypothetical protein WBC61_06435 [Dehalococcoidia bacterium]